MQAAREDGERGKTRREARQGGKVLKSTTTQRTVGGKEGKKGGKELVAKIENRLPQKKGG